MVRKITTKSAETAIKPKRIFLKARYFIILIVLLAGFLFYRNVISNSSSEQEYQTSQSEKGTLVVSLSASGSVQSSNISTITTQATGTVKKVYVKEGDTVQKGQKIAEIDLDEEGRQAQSSAYSNYIAAKTSLASANNNYRSTQASIQKIYDEIKGHDSDETLAMKETRTKAEVANDNAYESVVSAQTKISSAWIDYTLSSPVISAPTNGTVSSLTIAEGLTLNAQTSSSGSRTGQRIAVLLKEGNPIVSVNLSEIDVPQIKTGQKATVTFDSLSDKTFSGEVVAVDRIGTTSSNVTTYPALIKLDSGSTQILPNMAATANIIVKVKENAILVPSTAVTQSNNQSIVKVLKDGQIVEVIVEVGDVSDSQTEIVSGIGEGENVVTSSTSTSQGESSQTRSVFGGLGGGSNVRFVERR